MVEAQRTNVLVQIAKTELRAPADGLILARNATLGGVVMAQTAPLFRIAIGGEFELAATVAETALPRLAKGMTAEVSHGWPRKPDRRLDPQDFARRSTIPRGSARSGSH